MVMMLGDYLFSREIVGTGMQGKVLSVKHKETGAMFAAKITAFDQPKNDIRFAKEVAILEKLEICPGVVSMKDSFCKGNAGITILEKMPFDLMTLIERDLLTIEQRKKLFKLVCLAVKSCHEHDVAHFDLKPENILVSADYSQVKLCGNSEILTSHSLVKCCSGTMVYSAPEVLSGSFADGRKADVWSLGVLYHILLSNYFPFLFTSDVELRTKVQSGQILIHESLSSRERKFVLKMLNINPEKRVDLSTQCKSKKESLKMLRKWVQRSGSKN